MCEWLCTPSGRRARQDAESGLSALPRGRAQAAMGDGPSHPIVPLWPCQADRAGQKWRSRPVSRVLSWTTIPLGPASRQGSSSAPGDGPSQPIVPLFGLAPGGVYRALRRWPRRRWALTPPFHPYHAPLRAVRRSVLCCTSRRLAPPRRYLAPCSVEPGLSSARSSRDAVVWPTPPTRIVSQPN